MNTDEKTEVRKKLRSAMYLVECHELQYQAIEPVVFELLDTLLTSEAQKREEAVREERERIATELDRYAHESHSATINIKHLMNLLVPNPTSR